MAGLIGAMGSGLFLVFIILLAILGAFIIMAIAYYNKFVVSKRNVENAKSSIEVCYQQRLDLIPNLVDVVKGYVKHEKEMFEKIAELRSEYAKTKDIKVGDELDGKINSVLAIAENYPELKASENVKTLQLAIVDVEEHLQASRRLYNANVSNLNQKIASFPTNIIASMKWIESKEYFMAEEEKRDNVEIDL